MRFARVFPVAFALTVAGALPALAQSVSLGVKPGLWEMISSAQVNGAPPIPALPPGALASLPPEQRAQLQASAALAGILGQPVVTRMCITADDLRRGFSADQEASNCTHTVTSNTGSVMEVQLTCTGDHPMTATIRYQAVNDATVSGKMDMAMSVGGAPMTMSRTIDGKWLGADCGDVKPFSQQ